MSGTPNTMSAETETLAILLRDLGEQQKELSERMYAATLKMEGVANRLDNAERSNSAILTRMEKLDAALFSTDIDRPGLAVRLDRIEQSQRKTGKIIGWVFGGGAFAFLAGVLWIYRVLEHLPQDFK